MDLGDVENDDKKTQSKKGKLCGFLVQENMKEVKLEAAAIQDLHSVLSQGGKNELE